MYAAPVNATARATAARTVGSVLLPKPPGFQAGAVLMVGAAAVALGLIMRWWPWHRWPDWVSLLLVPLVLLFELGLWLAREPKPAKRT